MRDYIGYIDDTTSGICQKVTDVLGVFSSGTPVGDEAFPVSCADTPDKQEHLEDEFMNYIDSAFYPHPVHPYTLLRGYNSFMIPVCYGLLRNVVASG